MRRAFVATVASAAGLVAIVGAQAKAPQGGIDVCGASGCTHVAAGPDTEQLYIGTSQVPWHAATPAPFYVLHLRWSSSSSEDQIVYWIPAARRVRWGGGTAAWTYPEASAETILRQAIVDLAPFAVQLMRVTVGGRAVTAPQTYVRLFRHARWMPAKQLDPSWLRLRLTTSVPTPWSDEAATILLHRKAPYLYVDGAVLKIPP